MVSAKELPLGDKFPVVSGRQTAEALQRLGFQILSGRGKGSHMALWRDGVPRPIIVPDHRELDRGTLASILRTAGISREAFIRALRA